MENILTTESVFDKLVKVLDTNFGYVDEEKAETVAERLIRSGLIKEEKLPMVQGTWEKQDANLVWNDVGLYSAAYKCSRCGELNVAETSYCPNCGANMRRKSDGT